MKKLFAFLFVAVFLFSLSSCANPSGNRGNSGGAPSDQSSNFSDPSNSNSRMGGVSSGSPSSADAKISRGEAINIALNHVGVGRENAVGLEAEPDYKRGVLVWEVDFDFDGYEYSYDINAENGAIVKNEKEIDR